MKLHSDLREFIELLNSSGVDYVVVGGHAVAYHGYPRYTGDIGFLVRPSQKNALLIMAVLSKFGFDDIGLSATVFEQPGQVVQLGRPPNRIDILTRISGVDFDEVRTSSKEADIDGLPIRVIGRDALLKNKRATDRAKDRADVEELEKLITAGS